MSLAELANFNATYPTDLGWQGSDPEKSSSLLTPFSFDGVAFGSMHKYVVPIFTDLLTELVPHIPGGLIKGTCGCYNPGSVTGSGKRSFHTYGIAIDVNWGANPMNVALRKGTGCVPANSAAIAKKYGCVWGGTWNSPKDCMHYEVHLTPAQARAYEGEDVPLTPADIAAVWAYEMPNGVTPTSKATAHAFMTAMNTRTTQTATQLAALQKQVNALAKPADIAKAVIAALPKGQAGGLTEADIESALRTVFADAAKED